MRKIDIVMSTRPHTDAISRECLGKERVGQLKIAMTMFILIIIEIATSGRAARAETLEWALVTAYQNNPQINAQRAAVRATDEGVPQALSNYRPRVSATASIGTQRHEYTSKSGGSSTQVGNTFAPHSVGVTATQTLFNGFQSGNRTRQAETQVSAARATLAVIEQNLLLNAATAYMNLLRDDAVLDLQRRNVEVLREQLRQTRDRFNAGDVTRTDVAQSESRLAAGRTQVAQAEANYSTSRSVYRQLIGREAGKLAAVTPVDRFAPKSLKEAVSIGRDGHPNVAAAAFGIDVALLQVKINEGALLPTVTATATVQQAWEQPTTSAQLVVDQFNASLAAQVSIPIYQGGQEYSLIRQAKQTLNQKRFDLETTRDAVEQSIIQKWSELASSKAQIQSAQAQVDAAEIALGGVSAEAHVGQRTTLDVLNAQQELVNARVAVVSSQRDRLVASFALLAAVGKLSVQVLGLKVRAYDPGLHQQQVRDMWVGVGIPDGR
jgi:outer membrane protein